MNTEQKYEKLKNILKDMGDVVVAYSGGVDSTFLLRVAKDVLGEKVLGILATSPTYPSREYDEAMKLASQIGVRVKVIETKETDDIKFRENPVDRCYYCKTELFTKIKDIAKEEGFTNIADGSNADDVGDYRPGMKALEEKKVRSPLKEAGLTKNEIRRLSKMLNLPKNQAAARLTELVEDKVAVRIEKGVYKINPSKIGRFLDYLESKYKVREHE